MQRLSLDLPTLDDPRLYLAALDGVAELLAEAGNPFAASRLLARVLVDGGGSPTELALLPVAVRDRALAQLFIREFGSEVDAEVVCGGCAEKFSFCFSLSAVLASQAETAAATGLVPGAGGWWTLEDGAPLRPPTLDDLVRHHTPQALIAALGGGEASDEAEALLEAAAPTLSFDIGTNCPHCALAQDVAFDIAGYLIEALAAERPMLIREAHLIASRYGWGHATIMALPRADRRAYAQLIIAERTAAAGFRRAG
jgi:hypothetical protein